MAAKHDTGLEEEQCHSGEVVVGHHGSSLVSQIALSICVNTPHSWLPEAPSELH